MRFDFDPKKSHRLATLRGCSFDDIQEIFCSAYYLDQRSVAPEQYRAIGWVKGILYSLIYEVREDSSGEYYHLVTLWKSTKEEQKLYEKNI